VVEDRVQGLDAGADDYLVKPFDPRELRARLEAITRRHLERFEALSLRFADLELEPGAHAVRVAGHSIELTRTEYQLLELFMLNPRRVLSSQLIYERIWGYDFGMAGNSLRVYIGYLRRKLESGGRSRLIHTVRGVGYVLREHNRGLRPYIPRERACQTCLTGAPRSPGMAPTPGPMAALTT
jgi:two-component system, OmpR family, response regulator MprA